MRRLASARHRDTIALVVALSSGLAIAWIDAGPSWDDTGITAGLLALAGGLAAVVSGRRPWLWALLVGLPTPLVESTGGGDVATFGLVGLATIGFAAAGAAVGWVLSRASRPTPA